MRALVVCVSKYYGNTGKVAQAMADVLDAQIVNPKDVNPNALAEFDLVGFGSGIYFAKHDPTLFELTEKLPRNGGKAFIFSTRGRNSFFEDKYHKPLREALTAKGFTVVGEFSCRGFSDYYKVFKLFGGVNKGHPTDKELENAKAFVLRLKKAE
ncbi:MAG: flavodoxin family protein [Candidatus Bathyarchaeia archaeon]|jgi:flavodoxin